jgi:hypothetical protein
VCQERDRKQRKTSRCTLINMDKLKGHEGKARNRGGLRGRKMRG